MAEMLIQARDVKPDAAALTRQHWQPVVVVEALDAAIALEEPIATFECLFGQLLGLCCRRFRTLSGLFGDGSGRFRRLCKVLIRLGRAHCGLVIVRTRLGSGLAFFPKDALFSAQQSLFAFAHSLFPLLLSRQFGLV